jgi:hypothetical protein
MEIKIKVTPSLLEDIARILRKESDYCYSIGNKDTTIFSALYSTSGEKILLTWEPIFEEDGKIKNP